MVLAIQSLLQLIFVDTPRVSMSQLVPGGLQDFIRFGQTLNRKDLAFTVPLFIVAAGLVKLIASFLNSYFIERAGHRVAHAVRYKVLERFLNSSGNVLDLKNTDEIANQLMMDTALLQGMMSKGTLGLLRDGCVVIAVLGSMFFLAPKPVAVLFVCSIPFLFLLRKISGLFHFYASESAKRQVQLATRAMQTKNGLLTVFGLRSHDREIGDFKRLAEGYYSFIRGSFFVRTIFRPGTEFFAIILLAAALQWRMNSSADFSVATYSALFVLVATLFRPLKNISQVATQWAEMSVLYKRLSALLEELSFGSAPSPVRSSLESSSAFAVLAENVEFQTGHGNPLVNLQGMRLEIPKGARVAFVGESGAGKTTFLRLLAGTLVASKGQIEIESNFLYLTQNPYVFRGKVRENIVYANIATHPQVGQEDVLIDLVQALKLAFSSSTAVVFLNKALGFLGDGISGGERARVAHARALFESPHLLLLDEPTANLDALSTQAFWKAIEKWRKQNSERTVVVVSHSLNEILDFDLCYVFSGGKIVQQGKPSLVFPSLQLQGNMPPQ